MKGARRNRLYLRLAVQGRAILNMTSGLISAYASVPPALRMGWAAAVS